LGTFNPAWVGAEIVVLIERSGRVGDLIERCGVSLEWPVKMIGCVRLASP